MAVILAMRASSWAFCAAVMAASALAREWEVLQGKQKDKDVSRGSQHCSGFPLVPPKPNPKGLGRAVLGGVNALWISAPSGCNSGDLQWGLSAAKRAVLKAR